MLPSYKNIVSKLIISIYGLLFAGGMPILYGIEMSYSRYYLHDALLLGISLALLSIGLWLHKNSKWTIPSLALLFVAMFDMDYPSIHNVSAFIFFISSSWVIFLDDRFTRLGYYSLITYSLLLIPQNGLFWFEMIQIVIISGYHGLYSYRMLKTKLMREANDQT
tara:strand:+ start:9760 stop:10251 length:492 start_codon:yes stop_codon:yes gene_type:complete